KSADMESTGIAKIAKTCKLPFVIVRACSDSSRTVIPQTIIPNTNPDGFPNTSSIVTQALRSPNDWLLMSSLYYNFGKPQNSLQEAAKILLPYLSKAGQLTKSL